MLKANGNQAKYQDGSLVATVKISGQTDTWTYKFTNVPKYAAGSEIEYSVEEITPVAENGYTSSYTLNEDGSENKLSITNTRATETTTVVVNKEWDDNKDQDRYRTAAEAKVQLYKTVDGKKEAVADPVTVGSPVDSE